MVTFENGAMFGGDPRVTTSAVWETVDDRG